MAIQNIAIGTPGAGGGDPAYVAFDKINKNFQPSNLKTHLGLDKFAQNPGLNTVMAAPDVNAALIISNTGWGIYKEGVPNFSRALGILDGGTGAETAEQARINLGLDRFFQQGTYNTFVMSPNKDLLINLENNALSLYKSSNNTSYYILSGLNTVVDGNGFVKSASPVIKLFADKIQLNNEAKEQPISFEKLSVGDYIIKGSTGFAQEGWYIETPKDANGNVLFSVIYETLKNGDISVKTYKKKFNLETASIIADLSNPVDIAEGRWIDLRLQELPQPEIQIPESIAPPDFQPTGLAQAVAEALNYDPQ